MVLCLKRLLKVFFVRGSYKLSSTNRQRNPSTFQECLDKPRNHHFWKHCLVISLLLPTIFYMFYYKSDTKSKESGRLNKTTLTGNPKFVAESGIVSVKNSRNVDDPDISFNDDEQIIHKKPIPLGVTDNLPWCAVVSITRNVTVCKEVNKSLDALYAMVGMGGHYVPPDCRSRHKVAILVPYRKREEHLKVFLYNIHPFLMRQRLEYRIFVFEQSGTKFFNKGRLFNAGFLEIQKTNEWQCIIFHDVDLLPTDDRILYTCPILPRHMCAVVVENEHIPKYRTTFGGVTALTLWQYKKVNGYSNLYWGWGSEDDDMFIRLQVSGIGVTRYNKEIGRYVSLKHPKRTPNSKRHYLLNTAIDRYKTDGLNTLHYIVTSYASYPLYTHMVIDVDPPKLQDYITENSIIFTL